MSTAVDSWPPEKIGIAVSLSIVPFLIGMALFFIFPPDRWYCSLKRPCLSPPMWVYILAWAILYPLLGVSMTMSTYGRDPVYWTLPVLNLAVSILFLPVVLGLHSLFGGVVIAFLCLALGIGVLWQFANLGDYVPAGLMVPYVVWMLFALYLSWGFYVQNPSSEGGCPKKRVTTRRTRSACY